jgi:hypothetical protein
MSIDEAMIIEDIKRRTIQGNMDNISRTVHYEKFYRKHPEIQWAFLAGMVSRNAGYSMTDLKGEWMERSLGRKERSMLFFTYERANWLIFQDAYPQLLLYKYSKEHRKNLLHLMPHFFVSSFMTKEWGRFLAGGDGRRLCISQIINEQNLIQRPVITHPVYRKRVFLSLPFKLQNWLHFSTVLFPKLDGTLFGFSVHGFRQVNKRIELGKKLAALLLESEHKDGFEQFSRSVQPTGSRRDYEQFVYPNKPCESQMLRTVFPLIWHHRGKKDDWSRRAKLDVSLHQPLRANPIELTQWYKQKQRQMKAGILLKEILLNK